MMGQNKEVDEWLLGSGESAETAASKNIGAGLVEAEPKHKPKPVQQAKPQM